MVPASGRCLSWINLSTVYCSTHTHTHIFAHSSFCSVVFSVFRWSLLHSFSQDPRCVFVEILTGWIKHYLSSFSVPYNYSFAYEITEPQFIGDNFHNLPVPSQTESLMAEFMHNNMDEWPASTTGLKQTRFCCLQFDDHSAI